MSKASSHQVVSSGLKLFGSQFIQNVFLLGFGVYFAHVLSLEEMAVVSLFFLFTTLAPTFASLGLVDYLLRKVPEYLSNEEKVEASSLIKTIFVIQFLFSLLISVLMIVFAKDLSRTFLRTDSFEFQIQLVGVGALLQSSIVFFDAVIRSMQLFGKLAKVKIVANVISRIIALLLYLYMGFNGYLGGLLLGCLITLIMLVYYTKSVLFVKETYWEDYMFLIRFSFPYYLSNITRYLLMNVDKYVIGLFLTPAHLATYFIASKIVEYLKQIIDSFVNPILPKIAEFKAINMERVENSFQKSFRYMTFLIIPLSLGGAVLSYSLLYLYGGVKYTDGTLVMIILFVSMIGYGYTGLFGINIHVLGKPVDKLKINLAGGVINVLLSLLFVYLFKDTGVALAKFGAYFGAVIIGHMVLGKIIKLKYDTGAFKLSLFASVVMTLIIVIPQFYFHQLKIVPIHAVLGVIAYFIIVMPRLNQYDKDLIRSFLPGKLKWILKTD